MIDLVNRDHPHGNVVEDSKALHTLVDSIPALVAYMDCNMVLQYCNQPFKTWFSLNENVSGKSFPFLVGEEVFSQLQRHVGGILVGRRASFQILVTRRNVVEFLEATLSPDFDDRKQVKGFVFHGVDVTEKNRKERALKDYFENASIGLHWVNADGIIIWANPAELKMLGYSESEYIGRHISEFHADKQVIGDILNVLFDRKAVHNQEADMLCKDGSVRHVSINSTGLWEGNKFIHTRCFTVDITEQSRATRAMKESEERFKTMANMAPLIISTTDENGLINFLSVKWREVTGKDMEEGLGNGWINFIHPDDRENLRNSWMKSFSVKKSFEARFRFFSASGEYRPNYIISAPQYNAFGQFLGYIGILQDVSSDELIKSSLEKIVLERTEDLSQKNAELRKAEKDLRDKNRELKEINNQLSSFAHVASHDLQEPLRKIQVFSNRLFELEKDRFSDKGSELCQRIYDASRRMKNLIEDLLAYSRINNKSKEMECVDLNILLDEVLNELEIKIGEKGASVKNFGLPTLNVVKFQFYQLFLNLINNAIKFSRKGIAPAVTIRAEVIDGAAVLNTVGLGGKVYHITISDNGIGFGPQESERIFEIFQRLHGRSEYEGTGIGLAICKKIIENHNGIIIAEGSVNEGAVFHIYLPFDRTVLRFNN